MIQHHPFSLKYVWLKVRVLLIRFILSLKVRALKSKVDFQPGVEVLKIKVPSRDKGRSIPAFLYRPESASGQQKLPVHINLHGGGFCIPMHGLADEAQCRLFAKRLQANILDIGYRVSPENPFPAGLEDAIDAVAFCHSTREYNFDTSRVSIGGNSAGAGLALGASHQVGPSKVSSAALLYPPTDFSKMDPKNPRLAPSSTFRSGFALDHKAVLFSESCYLLDNVSREDPRLNPMYAETKNFPGRILLVCGTGDPIYNEDKRFIEKLQSEGHPDAEFMSIEGEGHAFDKLPKPGVSEKYKEEAYEALCQCIEKGWADQTQDRKA